MRHLNSISAIFGCALFTVLLMLLAPPPLNEGPKHDKIVKIKPKMVGEPLPTFEGNIAARAALEEALQNTTPVENPKFHTERENLLSLLQNLRNDPCNKDLREKYAKAVQSFRKNVDKDWDRYPPGKWPEVIMVNQKPVDISIRFNRPVIEEIILSVTEGFLMPNETTDKYRLGSQIGFYKARQESCANNTAYISPDGGNFRNEWEETISYTDENSDVEESYDQENSSEAREELIKMMNERAEEASEE